MPGTHIWYATNIQTLGTYTVDVGRYICQECTDAKGCADARNIQTPGMYRGQEFTDARDVQMPGMYR